MINPKCDKNCRFKNSKFDIELLKGRKINIVVRDKEIYKLCKNCLTFKLIINKIKNSESQIELTINEEKVKNL